MPCRSNSSAKLSPYELITQPAGPNDAGVTEVHQRGLVRDGNPCGLRIALAERLVNSNLHALRMRRTASQPQVLRVHLREDRP